MGKKMKNNYDISIMVKDAYKLTGKSSVLVSYLLLNKKVKNFSVKQMTNIFGKDRTTIQKYVNDLMKQNLLKRQQINLDRGFKYVYTLVDRKVILKQIMDYYLNEAYRRREFLEGLM